MKTDLINTFTYPYKITVETPIGWEGKGIMEGRL